MSMLVDTGAWYAIADASDRHHEEASRFYTEHAGRTPFVTTDLIVAETWALLNAHLGRSAALTFWETLRATRIPIVIPEPIELGGVAHRPDVSRPGVQLRGLHHFCLDGAVEDHRGLRL